MEHEGLLPYSQVPATWASLIQSIPPHPISWWSILKEPPLPTECTIEKGIRPTWEWGEKYPLPNIFSTYEYFGEGDTELKRGKYKKWSELG